MLNTAQIPTPVDHDEYEQKTFEQVIVENIANAEKQVIELKLAYENMPAALKTMTRKQATAYQFYF